MQKKIKRLLRETLFLWDEPDDPKDWILEGFEKAAAEIAKLYERKVIGQRDGKITLQYATNKTTGVSFWHIWVEVNGHKFLVGTTSNPDMDGQRVRVIVEDIDESE